MQGVSRDYDWEEMLGGNGSKDEPGKISMRNAWAMVMRECNAQSVY